MKARTTQLTSIALFSALAIATQVNDGVAKSAEAAKPIGTGIRAPDATVTTLAGKTTTLKKIFRNKPTVLIFYRGGWCPFCNAHLGDLARVEDQISAKGYQIVAVSPDTPAELKKTLDKNKLTYTLISDSSAAAMKKYGVAFRVDDETYKMYLNRFSLDLEKSSGQKHHVLPVPSVYVIDRKGQIVFAHSNPDYKVRLTGEDILAALK